MQSSDNHKAKGVVESLRATLALLAFGLGTLAFLITIDHPEWFHIRPATGTAVAMSHAANATAITDGTAGNTQMP